MPKKPELAPDQEPTPEPEPDASKAKQDPHDHPHDHSKDHPTRAELDELRAHKHEPEKPEPDKPSTKAEIDAPPPEVKPEKKERRGPGLFI